MTKNLWSVAAVLLLALAGSFAAMAEGTPIVVATHSVIGEFVQIVGDDLVDVVTIIPSGFCPAHYDLSPRDYAALLEADVIFYSGLEPWVEELISGSVAEGTVIKLPSVWNTPPAAVGQVEAIASHLAERFPASADTFAANAASYIDDLNELGTSLLEKAGGLDVASVPVVCMQWQAGFVGWLGFDVAVTYGRPEELSVRDLVELAEQGLEAGAQLVIDNLQSGIEFGGKLAREVGAVHVVLSNFPGALPNTATVVDLLTRNAEAMFTAIEPIE